MQYAAASRLKLNRLWNTGSPACAGDDNLDRGRLPLTPTLQDRAFALSSPNEDGVRGSPPLRNYLAAMFTASLGRLDSRACSVAMVERSQTPSTLAGRK
jgi:hypothetical protein